jgi:hypothetical protein
MSKRYRKILFFILLIGWGAAGRVFAQVPATVDLQVAFVSGGTAIDFGDLRSLDQTGSPVSDVEISQVRLSVRNTSGQTYILTQTVNGETVNQQGATLPPDAIRFRVQIESGGGLVRTPDMAPLGGGESEIYFSDATGQDVVLLITYEIRVPGGQKAGRYRNTIHYRVDVR